MNPQTPERICSLVDAHLNKEFAKLQSKNHMTIGKTSEGMPWVTDYGHWNYKAASRATQVSLFDLFLCVSCSRMGLIETMRIGGLRPDA